MKPCIWSLWLGGNWIERYEQRVREKSRSLIMIYSGVLFFKLYGKTDETHFKFGVVPHLRPQCNLKTWTLDSFNVFVSNSILCHRLKLANPMQMKTHGGRCHLFKAQRHRMERLKTSDLKGNSMDFLRVTWRASGNRALRKHVSILLK